jgi:hypothetical protein
MAGGEIITGRRRRTAGTFLASGGKRSPANEFVAIRKVNATAFSAVKTV